ncbi:11821_t:CDS:2 [Funneliformis geosporum]|uniref:11821_t:CDS:1 n=1 Tax=Funneliformis geosporum TaxID=1117311 RepID=A0A9W4WXL9_9GLOM|nr:11821_t:CDS:2 [Funneliformis geosporum]
MMKIISLTSFLPSPAQNALPRLPIFETVAVYHSTKGKGANKKYSFFHMYCVDVHSNLHHQINVVLVAIMRRRAASFGESLKLITPLIINVPSKVDRRSPQNVSKENSSPKNSPNQKENGLDKSPSNKSHGCTFSSDSVQISETLIESNIRQDDHNFNTLQKILKSRRRTFEFQSLFSKNDKKRNQKDRHKKQQQLKGNGDNNKGKHPNGNESENENGNKQVSDDPAPIPPRISSLQSLNDQQVSSISFQANSALAG